MSGMNLKNKLANGEKVFGTFIQYVTNPAVIDIFPAQGLDFVVLNDEHNALDLGDFNGMQYAMAAKNIACLLRPYNRDPEMVSKACDSYADGVVIAYVEDVEELKYLVAAAKYRPLKGAALKKLVKTGEWPSETTRQYVEDKCKNTFFCAMIESAKALEDLDKICAVPGIDALLIGPNDLSVSLGIPEERDNPKFIDAVQRVIDVGSKHGIAAGAHYSVMSHTQRLIKQGGRFIPYASDVRYIQNGLATSLTELGIGSGKNLEKII